MHSREEAYDLAIGVGKMSNACAAPTQKKTRTAAVSAAIKSVFAGRGNSAAALQTLAVKFLVLGLNAATSVVSARGLYPAGRGEMAAIIMWPGFFSAMLTLGLPSSLTFNLRRHPDRTSETLGGALVLTLLIGTVTAILGFFFVPLWLTQYSHATVIHARWMLLASPLPMLLYYGRQTLEAKGNFFASNLSVWAVPFLTLVWLLVLMALGHITPVSGGVAYLFTSVPLAAILLVQVYAKYGIRFRNIGASLRRLLHFGLRAWGIDLLTALAVSESVLVVHFLPPAAMGTYVVAASLARILSVFQTSAVIVLYPRIAARDTADVIALTGFTLRITTLCAAAGAIAVGALGPVLLSSFYGSSYADASSIVIFRVLLGEVVLSGVTQVLAQAYLALERPGAVAVIQAVGVGIGWLVMPGLIQEFGAVGAPLGLVLSSVIRFAITFLMFPYILKTSAPRILPRREDLKVLAARFVSLTEKPATVA